MPLGPVLFSIRFDDKIMIVVMLPQLPREKGSDIPWVSEATDDTISVGESYGEAQLHSLLFMPQQSYSGPHLIALDTSCYSKNLQYRCSQPPLKVSRS